MINQIFWMVSADEQIFSDGYVVVKKLNSGKN